MPTIHPTAIVEPGAKVADTVRIGPYCVVGSDVTLDEGVEHHLVGRPSQVVQRQFNLPSEE